MARASRPTDAVEASESGAPRRNGEYDNGGERLTCVAKQRINPIAYAKALRGGSPRDEQQFLAGIRRRLGDEARITPLGRARSGIYLMAKFAVRDQRRKVLMSPFTIPDVVTMVTLAGAEPVFFDFEPGTTACDLDGLAGLIDEHTACVLITHHHLNEPHLRALAGLCQERGVYLFDDCAIAFGGTIGERPLGVLTDASIFSFSSFKLLNFFWGGMVTTRDPAFAAFLDRTVAAWPRLTATDYARQAKSCLQYDLASRPPIFENMLFPVFQRRVRASGAPRSLENARVETEHLNASLTSRPSLAAFAEWNRKLPDIDRVLAHRRAVAQVYWRNIGKYMLSARYWDEMAGGSCFVNFPVLVPEEACSDVCRDMMLAGFDVGRNLYPNVHRHPKYSGVSGTSVEVERLIRQLIYLPTHFGVSLAYAEAISDHLASLLSAGKSNLGGSR